MTKGKKALVLGATGGIGGAIASALLRKGWDVRGMVRTLPQALEGDLTAIEWRQGDAMRRQDVIACAQGCDAIVHAVNPPGYRDWDKVVIPMLENTIAGARAAGGARIVLPGTIYNFNPACTPLIDEDTPQHPISRKGAIRVEVEKRLESAVDVPVLILRAGDFFGPGARSSWFSQAMIASGKPVRKIVNPARGAGHSWAYLPDLAEAFASLMDMGDRLRRFERLQFEGLYDEDGHTLTDAIARVVGRKLKHFRFPWWAMKALAPFGGFPREAAEIAPNWLHPVRLGNRRLVDLLGSEPRTPLDTALQVTLDAMGCMTK